MKMKYLFFDVECSNCFGGIAKICEFGYVLTDEKFNVLKKDAIPMSPGIRKSENRFDLAIYKRDPTFQWAFEKDFYFECPEFPEFYELLKKLFEDEETIIFGYSVDNDIRYLGDTFKRYNLTPFEYIAFDIQRMMKYYSEKKDKLFCLKDAFKKLCSNDEFMQLDPHYSQDDAFMAMRVLQKMCDNLEITPLEMCNLCNNCKYDANEYLNKFQENKRLKEKNQLRSRNQRIWNKFCKQYFSMVEKDEFVGKIVTISYKIMDNKDLFEEIIHLIKTRNFIASKKIKMSDYLITLDEEDTQRLKNELKHPYSGKILNIDEFKNLEIKI